MSANMDLHIMDEAVTVESRVYPMKDQDDFATLTIGSGTTMVRLYVRKLEDLEKIAFELDTLIREARDEHGWRVQDAPETVSCVCHKATMWPTEDVDSDGHCPQWHYEMDDH